MAFLTCAAMKLAYYGATMGKYIINESNKFQQFTLPCNSETPKKKTKTINFGYFISSFSDSLLHLNPLCYSQLFLCKFNSFIFF